MGEPDSQKQSQDISARDAYNIVTDTVIGPNIRAWDNSFQAIFSAICLVIGSLSGWLSFWLRGGDWLMGLLGGAFCGLLAGLLGSGVFLMVFRAVQHLRGKHE